MYHTPIHFPIIDSTNEEAKRLINFGEAVHGQVIIADQQTGGHGRYGRKWESPTGNLYMSLILKLSANLEKIAQISFVMALAVGQALLEILPQNSILQYKWPNDVLVNKKKISGILLESIVKGSNINLIVGVGVNIANAPKNVGIPVTCLKNCGLLEVTSEQLFTKILELFEKELNLWQNGEFSYIRDRWLQYAYKINEQIEVNLGGQKMSGIFKGVNSDGELELLIDGNLKLIPAGEVYF
ncbi:MAG: birA [Rickettsiaceae bacterium]|jgi:BirA family biotin operon repressor/biotin-[acetyl-CoA-carboxylase] ligase|nr:birA [Rickettsiaceae bacterium]